MSSNAIRPGLSHTSQIVPESGGSVNESSPLQRQQLGESKFSLYSTLDPAHSQIRILRVHPAEDPMATPQWRLSVLTKAHGT
jgi:hypothetical protein